jgi:hypothetical protein
VISLFAMRAEAPRSLHREQSAGEKSQIKSIQRPRSVWPDVQKDVGLDTDLAAEGAVVAGQIKEEGKSMSAFYRNG